LDDRIKSLFVLADSPDPTMHADVGLKEPIPVDLLGEGFNSVLSMLFAMWWVEGGIALIDEIENGVHYSALSALWRAVGDAAEQAKVQVFATTHSFECINAAREVFREKPEGFFALHRFEAKNAEGVSVISFDPETLATSVDLGWEVR
jgi:AAA15 family ATPase/GTPase